MIDVILNPPQNPPQKKAQPGRKIKPAQEGDRPVKSLLKTISWRIIGTIDTITISFIITGEITSALSIGSIEVVSKMILYYFHERLWSKSRKFKKPMTKIDSHEFISPIRSN